MDPMYVGRSYAWDQRTQHCHRNEQVPFRVLVVIECRFRNEADHQRTQDQPSCYDYGLDASKRGDLPGQVCRLRFFLGFAYPDLSFHNDASTGSFQL